MALAVAVPLLLLCGLAGLAALPGSSSGGGGVGSGRADGVISEDVRFSGQSPPVYPSPDMTGADVWADAFQKAKDVVANLTLKEKVSITSGVASNNGCPGSVPGLGETGFPGLCLADAGQGLRATDFVSSFPAGLHVGASWNKRLARQRGAAMGGEFRRKGANVLLGPVVGPAGRVVRGGRNWEGFSSDPYLSGALVFETVDGIQGEGVMTSTKHFIANEQETNRNPSGDVAAVSSNIDDKTMHEIYLWAFQDAVKAGTASVMCSYQRVNNSYGCANSKLLNGLLKTELGFQGFVVSDWGAQHAGSATALAGMDMAMPGGGDFWGEKLVEAASNGSVPESRITDMAVRILSSWYQLDQDDEDDFAKPGFGIPKDVSKPHKIFDARDEDARPTIFDGAVEGHVLVKNTKDTLPLKKPRLMSLFGYSAKSPDTFAPMADDIGSTTWKFGAQAADPVEVSLGFASRLDYEPSNIGINGTMIHGGGSGATTPSLFLSPFEALKMKALEDSTALFHDFVSSSPLVDAASDACIVFGNAWASESYDRPAVRDDYTDHLIKHVADQCNKTVVVLHNAGVRLVEQFVDHPNVTAIIFAHLPGQDTGRALASLLYGDSNPSGKLPYTVARNESDYGGMLDPDLPEGEFELFPQSNFSEGVFVDYRHFDQNDLTPRYEFGFGLSYTTFEVADLGVALADSANVDDYPTGPVVPGGRADLWDRIAVVNATVRNTGDVDGAEVAQLYVGVLGGDRFPARQLRGFDKVFVEAGDEGAVSFNLTRRDLSVWDTTAQEWRLPRGEYGVYVGTSSRNLPLEGTFEIA